MKRVVSLLAVTLGLGAYAACGGGGNETTGPVTPPPSATSPSGSASTTSATPTGTGTTEAPKPSVAEQWKKLGAAMSTAWNAHDTKALAALYDDNATVGHASAKGWEDQKIADDMATLQAWWAGFPDVKMTLVRAIYKDDKAAMEWVCAGTNSGELFGEKATNKKATVHGVTISTLDKATGKIAHDNYYMDELTIMGQIGKGAAGMKFRAADPAPTGEPEMIMAKDGEDTSKNEGAIKAWYATFEKKDDKGFLAGLDDNNTWADYSQPADMKGKDAAKKFFGDYTKAFPDAKFNLKNVFSAGDYVIVESEMTGTFKGPLGGMKPTNKSATTHGVDVIKMKDGKALMGSSYMNGLEFAVAYGVMPMPKAPAPKTDKPADVKKPDATKPADTTKKPDDKTAPKK